MKFSVRRISSVTLLGAISAWTILRLAGCSLKNDPELKLGIVQDGIQLAYVGWSDFCTNASVCLRTGLSYKTGSGGYKEGRSTGAVRHRSPIGNGEATCGATFISKHYAVTAAHCVPYWHQEKPSVYDDGGCDYSTGVCRPTIVEDYSDLRIEQYDTTQLTSAQLAAQADVTPYSPGSTFPQWKRATQLGSPNYQVMSYPCTVAYRCGWGPYPGTTCPPEVIDARNAIAPSRAKEGVDTVLLYCPSRNVPDNTYYMTYWNSSFDPAIPTTVAAWWFHEILNLTYDNVQGGVYTVPTPAGNAANYMTYSAANWLDNYHYYQYSSWYSQNPQPLPLLSWGTWGTTFTNYTTKGQCPTSSLKCDQSSVMTNIPGCHGMSGSGIMTIGYLLGNVMNNNTDNLSTHICDPLLFRNSGSMQQALATTSITFLHPNIGRQWEFANTTVPTKKILTADRF